MAQRPPRAAVLLALAALLSCALLLCPATAATAASAAASSLPPCNIPNCDVCTRQSPDVCANCTTRYVLDSNGGCMVPGTCAVPNCAQCRPEDDTRCAACAKNLTLSASFTCVASRGNAAATPGHRAASIAWGAALMVAAVAAAV